MFRHGFEEEWGGLRHSEGSEPVQGEIVFALEPGLIENGSPEKQR